MSTMMRNVLSLLLHLPSMLHAMRAFLCSTVRGESGDTIPSHCAYAKK